MPQYMLSVWHAPGIQQDTLGPYGSEEEMHAAFQSVAEFNETLQAEGAWVFACGLEAPEEATVVDGTVALSADTDGPAGAPAGSRAGSPAVSDGPLSDGPAHLGGFWVVEAPGPDAARHLAARASAACGQRIEVRRLQG